MKYIMKGVLLMMKQTEVTNRFKWWYIEEGKEKTVKKYPDLLKKQEVQLVAMTRDDQIVRETVSIKNENQLAIANLGDKGNFALTPNQWVSPTQSERISNFWLANGNKYHKEDAVIDGIFTSLDNGKSVLLQEGSGVLLFGSIAKATFAKRHLEAIVPIGENEYIAWDGRFASLVGDRETDDTVISTYMAVL